MKEYLVEYEWNTQELNRRGSERCEKSEDELTTPSRRERLEEKTEGAWKRSDCEKNDMNHEGERMIREPEEEIQSEEMKQRRRNSDIKATCALKRHN